MRLEFNIFPDYVSSNIISNTSDKIAIIPQLSQPKLFPDFGYFLNISRTNMLFIICTTSAGEYLGGASKNMYTWSSSTSIVSIAKSYSSAIWLNTSFYI